MSTLALNMPICEVASTFVGRRADLAAIAQRFDEGARLVTIVAPGGMGKTRVAMRYAALAADSFAAHGGSGTWFCDLTDAADVKAACSVVAAALGLALAPSKDMAGLVSRLGRELERMKRVLIVLDNVEHLAAPMAEALRAWTGLADQARFLVTSRTVLGAPGEHLVVLEPLELPTAQLSRDALLATEAVELFARRAREVRPGFDPGALELAALADVVRATDGIPLAIELAAAKLRVLSIEQMRRRMGDPLALLTSRDERGKHASMRRAILDSLDQLAPGERALFLACSIFHAGFTLEAAEEILAAEGLNVLSALDALVARSLVRVQEADGEMRFSMFETMREVAALEVEQRQVDHTSLRVRYTRHYARRGAELGAALDASGDRLARTRLTRELGNLLAAFEHAIARREDEGLAGEALSIALALEPVLFQRGQFELSLGLLERAQGQHTASSARSAVARAIARYELGETEAAQRDLEGALELAAQAEDALLETLASLKLGEIVELRGDTAAARALFARGLDCLERAPAGRLRQVREAEIRARLGHASRREGQLDQAEAEARRALALYRDTDSEEELPRALYEVGVLALFHERYDETHAHFEEALAIARRLGQRQAEGALLCGRGVLLQEQGKLAEALREHADAVRIFHEIGSRHREGSALYYLGGAFLEQRSTPSATKLLSQSLEVVRQAGMRRYEALVAGAQAVASADIGDARAASGWLDVARSAVALCHSEPTLAATLAIHEACVACATAPLRSAEAYVSEAHAIALRDPSDDVRFALRVLLARAAPLSRPVSDALIVAEDGSTFQLPGSERALDLSRRAPLRKILVALAQLRIESPGESLSMYEVIRAGWGNDRIGQAAAANRVRVALATLRKLGLRDAIVTGRGGYLLSPSIAVTITPRGTSSSSRGTPSTGAPS